MLRFALLSLLLLAPQDKDKEKPETGGPFSVQLNKPSSRYWMTVPRDYDATQSYPLLVVCHGAGDTAENFIKVWTRVASDPYKWILVAVKSAGQAWEDSDKTRVLNTIADVKKTYKIDPGRVFLLGYSSGGFFSSNFGVRNHTLFRTLTCIAGAHPQGGSDFKQAATHMAAFFCVGELDPNKQIVTKSYEAFKKGRFDTELKVVDKMEHSPLKPEAITWCIEKIHARDTEPGSVLRRGKTALRERRTGDAIAAFLSLAALDPDVKGNKKYIDSARKEIAKLEKKAQNDLKKAKAKLDRNDSKGALKILTKILRDYRGLDEIIKEATELVETARKK